MIIGSDAATRTLSGTTSSLVNATQRLGAAITHFLAHALDTAGAGHLDADLAGQRDPAPAPSSQANNSGTGDPR